jgi:hypothetical protein
MYSLVAISVVSLYMVAKALRHVRRPRADLSAP